RAGPPVFGLVGLLLQGGGQAVAEELSSPSEQEVLAGVEHRPEGGLPGLLFQMGGQFGGHLGDLTLQGRLRLLGRFGHLHPSSGLGNSGNLLPNTSSKCQISLTHPASILPLFESPAPAILGGEFRGSLAPGKPLARLFLPVTAGSHGPDLAAPRPTARPPRSRGRKESASTLACPADPRTVSARRSRRPPSG